MSSKFKSKGVNFQKCDEQLVLEIIKYQEREGLSTFIAAVRQLCKLGLKNEKN